MNKKIVAISILLLMMCAMAVSVFALSISDVSTSLQNGKTASQTAVNASKTWTNAAQAEAGWDKYASQINRAESAVQDAENYESVNGSLPANMQQWVREIKANLRQIKNKMSAFGIPTSWAIDL